MVHIRSVADLTMPNLVCFFSCPQTSSELSEKESLINGHHAESWKRSKSENVREKSKKIKVRQSNPIIFE